MPSALIPARASEVTSCFYCRVINTFSARLPLGRPATGLQLRYHSRQGYQRVVDDGMRQDMAAGKVRMVRGRQYVQG